MYLLKRAKTWFQEGSSKSPLAPRKWKEISSETIACEDYCQGNSEHLSRSRRVGSMEDLARQRPTSCQLTPETPSRDSLEVHGKKWGSFRRRKAKSMIVRKDKPKSPLPMSRMPINEVRMAQPTIIHEGVVKRTKFAESGKRCKKNWTDCYMILTKTALLFYKDHASYLSSNQITQIPGVLASPITYGAELVLSLHGAIVHMCIQNMHTRRHTRSMVLLLDDFDQFLIQDKSEEGASRWLHLIQRAIYKSTPPEEYDHTLPELESARKNPLVTIDEQKDLKQKDDDDEQKSKATTIITPIK